MAVQKRLSVTYTACIVTAEVECVNFAARAPSLGISKWIFVFDGVDITTPATVQMFQICSHIGVIWRSSVVPS